MCALSLVLLIQTFFLHEGPTYQVGCYNIVTSKLTNAINGLPRVKIKTYGFYYLKWIKEFGIDFEKLPMCDMSIMSQHIQNPTCNPKEI